MAETVVNGSAMLANRLRQSLQPPPSLREVPREFVPAIAGDHGLNPGSGPFRPGPLMPAAVLVAVVEYPDDLQVLFTRRTDHLSQHSGQISFPGGRVEADDTDLIAAALRETEEEIGLERRFIDVIGALDTYVTVTGFAVTPVVGLVRPGYSLKLDRNEVAEAFAVPLRFLLDPVNYRHHRGVINGIERHWWAIPYRDYYIWGATAGMLRNLFQRFDRAG